VLHRVGVQLRGQARQQVVDCEAAEDVARPQGLSDADEAGRALSPVFRHRRGRRRGDAPVRAASVGVPVRDRHHRRVAAGAHRRARHRDDRGRPEQDASECAPRHGRRRLRGVPGPSDFQGIERPRPSAAGGQREPAAGQCGQNRAPQQAFIIRSVSAARARPRPAAGLSDARAAIRAIPPANARRLDP